MERMAGKSALIVGGGSGIGLATAGAMLREGARVWIAGRSESRLEAALQTLDASDRATSFSMDMTDQRSVDTGLARFESAALDALVITASSAVHGPFESVPLADVQSMFDSKLWGPYRVTRAALPKLTDGASVTFFSGVLSRRPGVNCSGLGAVNAAVEGLTRGLALELGPRIRVNCISPGMVRSEAYAAVPEDKREAMYRDTGASLPVARVGEVHEIAEAVMLAATNGYITGQVLDIDGGHMVRQYARH